MIHASTLSKLRRLVLRQDVSVREASRRLKEQRAPEPPVATMLTLNTPPLANLQRYDALRNALPFEVTMHDVIDAFKALGLHGMASAWPEVLGAARMKSLDHEAVLHQLIKAETAQREVRSMVDRGRLMLVMVLTAKDHVENRVKGLELGADDYFVKPFSFAELASH